MNTLSGKVIAISGGASGIGLATAKLLISRGALVSASDVQKSAFAEATKQVKQCGGHEGNFLLTYADVRNSEEVEAWIRATKEKFGKLDGAANMAGVSGRSSGTTAANIEDAEWNFIIGVNLTGTMLCQRAQLQVMENGGSIVNIASVAGIQGVKGQAAYSASKHGVIGLSKSAAKELGSRGIRVNVIAPGLIDTPMLATIKDTTEAALQDPTGEIIPLRRLGQPMEVANLAAFLLGDEAPYITGTVQMIDGGAAA